MKVARLIKPGEILLEEVAKPQVKKGTEVLLKTLYFGICGSDMQIYHGLHKYAAMPVIMGHEVAALIEEVGTDVSDYKVGQKVAVEPQIYCGECYPCQIGRFNVCENLKVFGVHTDGFNAEYVVCDQKYLHHVPDDMDPQILALVEPFAVGVGSAKRSSRLAGGNVCVIGAGTIGNFTAQAAKGLGAKKVLVTDLVDDKLNYALECGIDYVENTSKMSLKEAIEKNFGKQKADVIIDCVGMPIIFEQMLEAARPSSDLVVTGNYKKSVTIEMPLIQRQEISVLGHMMYVREDYTDAIRLLYEGKVNTEKIISKVYDFDNYPEAYLYWENNPQDVMKILVNVGDK